jgi:KaiC/GvpD/RAD55 family RecA-like ATPase
VSEKQPANVVREYTEDLQKLFLEMMIDHPESYVRVQNIFNVENFNRSLKDAAKFVKEHADKHKAMPTVVQVNAVTGTELKVTTGLGEEHHAWFMEEFENFSKRKELERAILKSADLLEKGDYAPVEKLIKDAVQIGLVKDIGTDYFKDPRARLMAIKAGNGQVSTGWPALDRALFGGMNRGELNIFAGGSGSGKSLFMQNISVNWFTAGLNGIYLTLELSEGLCSMRIDSMVANCSTKEIFKNLDDVELKVAMAGKKSGAFQVKYMPAQSNVNDIRSYIKEFQVQTGKKVDFLMVDYLDLLMPVTAKVSPNDLFVKDKYVSEELRNLAKELNVLFITASQLNRSAVDEVEFDHSHISGGISKINTADNVFGIFTSRAMRERGKYQLQLLKTRSSSGVGMKVDLDFNVESLRIVDAGEDEGNAANPNAANAILGKIKPKSTTTTSPTKEVIDPETGEITKAPVAEVQSKNLKNMLANLKSN